MSFRYLTNLRKLSTSARLHRPSLSTDYKSNQLWARRLNCKLISDENIIKSINTKILSAEPLNCIEYDIFMNIATADHDDLEQMKDTVLLLKNLRRSIYASHILPSTNHAFCRFYLDSNRLETLLHILENRIDYGVFPDFFAYNLLSDRTIESEKYSMGSRLASLVMLQEDFGQNLITDKFSLYSVAKYIESHTDFADWRATEVDADPILNAKLAVQTDQQNQEGETKEVASANDDDEEEDDAEYIRVPFLRNPYHDDHFDIQDPRVLCGKTLVELGLAYTNIDRELSIKSKLLGNVLRGNWLEASKIADECAQTSIGLGSIKDTIKFYIENTHEVAKPSEEQSATLVDRVENSVETGPLLSDLADKVDTSDTESRDIKDMENNINLWSEARCARAAESRSRAEKQLIIAEIAAKKKELQEKEEYLYFYDRLMKSKLSKIKFE